MATEAEEPEFKNVARTFVKYYYETFDGANRINLAPLYKDHSMLTWQQFEKQGPGPIMEHLTTLQFSRIEHSLTMSEGEKWQDAVKPQPVNAEGALLVNVAGRLLVDEERYPLNFTETFLLMPDGAGGLFVQNHIFRLI